MQKLLLSLPQEEKKKRYERRGYRLPHTAVATQVDTRRRWKETAKQQQPQQQRAEDRAERAAGVTGELAAKVLVFRYQWHVLFTHTLKAWRVS